MFPEQTVAALLAAAERGDGVELFGSRYVEPPASLPGIFPQGHGFQREGEPGSLARSLARATGVEVETASGCDATADRAGRGVPRSRGGRFFGQRAEVHAAVSHFFVYYSTGPGINF